MFCDRKDMAAPVLPLEDMPDAVLKCYLESILNRADVWTGVLGKS